MRLPKDVRYQTSAAFAPHIDVTIPAGTEVIPATNMPESSRIKYWAEPWPGMSDDARDWCRTIGFGLDHEDVAP